MSLTLSCMTKGGTACGLMRCPVKGDTPCFTRIFAAKKKVLQLLVFSLKPMSADKRAAGVTGEKYEKTRSCLLEGQNHEGFQAQSSTTNADAQLLRLLLAAQANPYHVFASFDVSNAFFNTKLSEDVVILKQPAPEVTQLGLIKPGTLYQCTKACYGLREAPRLWEEARDETLCAFTLELNGEVYSLRQSAYHPSLWFVVTSNPLYN